MEPLDKKIIKFLNPVFSEFTECKKIEFIIYIFDDNDVHCCEESICINDLGWNQLPDDKYSNAYDKIQEAISKLPDLPELDSLKKELKSVAEKTWEKACSNPLNKIWQDFWRPENLEPFSKLIEKDVLKRFPAKYVDYIAVAVHREGDINFYPNGEDE